MCDIPVMFALTALRRHLARKHSTNFKCDKEGCNKTFAKQYQVRIFQWLQNYMYRNVCVSVIDAEWSIPDPDPYIQVIPNQN